jgi:hypothetical protein
MRILTVEPRDIHIAVDFSFAEIKHILNFCELAHPLYQKVYSDENRAESSFIHDVFIDKLRLLAEDIEKGVKDGS